MGLGVFLRYLRLVQILLVAIISISLAASFLKVGSNQLNDKGTSFSSVQGTGIVALLFGLTSLAELMLEYFVVRVSNSCHLHPIGVKKKVLCNLQICFLPDIVQSF